MKKATHKSKETAKSIIHEINNLLTNCHLSIEMVLSGSLGKVNNRQKKYLKGAISEGKKIKELIKKISNLIGNKD